MPGAWCRPQMIEVEAFGAIASLWLKRSITPSSAASGQGPRSSASLRLAAVAAAAQVLEEPHVPALGQCALERHVLGLQQRCGSPSGRGPPKRCARRVGGIRHPRRGAVGWKSCSTLSRKRMQSSMKVGLVAPLQEPLGVHRREATDRGALLAQVVGAGVQQDLRAEVRLAHLQAELAPGTPQRRGWRCRRRSV